VRACKRAESAYLTLPILQACADPLGGECPPASRHPLTQPRASVRLHRDDLPALMSELQRRCAAWCEPVPSLLGATPRELVSSYPVYDRGESYPFPETRRGLDTSAIGRVTLLGDAAHPMSPFKAQGANQALMDAIQLADTLAIADLGEAGHRTDAPEANLREYEHQMYARSEPQRLRSRRAVEDLHSLDVRVAATTGKGGPPCEELVHEFRRAHVGCWDAEHAPTSSKASRRLRTRLDEKIVDARKAVRRRQSRRRVKQRALEASSRTAR
jgi:hypothetical protein